MQKESDTIAIQEKLKELFRVIRQCQEERNRSEHKLANIAKTHERMQSESKISPYFKTKLYGLYKTALQDSDSEAEFLRKALGIINDVRTIRNRERFSSKTSERPKETIPQGTLMIILQQRGITLPLWVPKNPGESPPALCGAVQAESSYIAKVGDMVAALVKGKQGEDWILASVTQYNSTTNKYEIDDIDEKQKDKLILSRRNVIPLPLMRANPETNPEALFRRDDFVLALYPQSTCFYPGLVKDPPSTFHEDYQILFEDSEYSEGYSPAVPVCQGYVLAYREGRKK